MINAHLTFNQRCRWGKGEIVHDLINVGFRLFTPRQDCIVTTSFKPLIGIASTCVIGDQSGLFVPVVAREKSFYVFCSKLAVQDRVEYIFPSRGLPLCLA